MVEATIVFPVIILITVAMIFAGMYIHSKLVLQYAVQKAATAVAIEHSDLYVRFDDAKLQYTENENKKHYFSKLRDLFLPKNREARIAKLVENIYGNSLAMKGNLSVESKTKNYVVYKEFFVRGTIEYEFAINLSLIGIPRTFQITAQAKTVVQNPDDFIRTLDLGIELTDKLLERLGVKEKIEAIREKLSKGWEKISSYLFE